MNSFMIIAISWELQLRAFSWRRRLEDYGEELEDAMAQVLVGKTQGNSAKLLGMMETKTQKFPKKVLPRNLT